ncbi:MAG: protoporphyrinogen oxidase [Deltaproteobacteria bacterium]|nr:protoporphyrinogen oxidase [Deltaproteobacteria bacterium]
MSGGPRVAVVGAGVAGLAAARVLHAAPGADVVVLEASRRVGGLVESERLPEGFLLEHGADCFMTTKPAGLAAVRALGLDAEIVCGQGARRTYVARGDALVPIPPILGPLGPAAAWAFLRSPLLPLRGKLRAACEPFVPPRRGDADESIADFAVRRFGRALTEAVLDPLLGGVYGADTRRLSMAACLPRLRALEQAHGSIVRGMRQAMRARRRRARVGEPVLPPVATLRRGMGSLPDAAARGLGVELGAEVRAIAPAGRGFRLTTAKGVVECDGLVLATPAWVLPPLLEAFAPDLAADLASVAHKRLDVVTLAWRRGEVPHPLDGTGFVRAVGDPRPTAACTWASEKWPERAPAGAVLVRSVLTAPELDDEDLVAAARADLAALLGVTAAPALMRVRRIARATPIYAVGHPVLVGRIAERTAALGPVALAGNAYEGVGIPDCIASGETAARSVLAALALRGPVPADAAGDPSAAALAEPLIAAALGR